MPQNKRESLIYTVLMCFVMELWMSQNNAALRHGGPGRPALTAGSLGFPYA